MKKNSCLLLIFLCAYTTSVNAWHLDIDTKNILKPHIHFSKKSEKKKEKYAKKKAKKEAKYEAKLAKRYANLVRKGFKIEPLMGQLTVKVKKADINKGISLKARSTLYRANSLENIELDEYLNKLEDINIRMNTLRMEVYLNHDTKDLNRIANLLHKISGDLKEIPNQGDLLRDMTFASHKFEQQVKDMLYRQLMHVDTK